MTKRLVVGFCIILSIYISIIGYLKVKILMESDTILNTYTKIICDINKNVDPNVGYLIAKEVKVKSEKYGLPPLIIISLINKESNFKIMAESSARCVGLMQINPKAHPEKVGDLPYNELFHISNNIDIGCQILKEYGEGNTIKGALEKYLGKSNKKYLEDILVTYTDLNIKYGKGL